MFTPDGSIVDGEILDHKNGTYEFVYTVPKEGDFSLALRLYDQHIKGSPFRLTVTRALETEVEVGGDIFIYPTLISQISKLGKFPLPVSCLVQVWKIQMHIFATFNQNK